VHQAEAPVGGEEHGHGVIGHLVDEDVGHVGDHDACLGGRVHVHGVRPHAAEADHLAVLQPLDDGGGDAAVARDDGVRVLGQRDELLFRLGGELHDLRADGIEGLPLDRIGTLRGIEGHSPRGPLDDDLELLLVGRHACDLLVSVVGQEYCRGGAASRPLSNIENVLNVDWCEAEFSNTSGLKADVRFRSTGPR
jgi:hypothetical protein